jgi:hypothetical protein
MHIKELNRLRAQAKPRPRITIGKQDLEKLRPYLPRTGKQKHHHLRRVSRLDTRQRLVSRGALYGVSVDECRSQTARQRPRQLMLIERLLWQLAHGNFLAECQS